jgi:hypothetical protein
MNPDARLQQSAPAFTSQIVQVQVNPLEHLA